MKDWLPWDSADYGSLKYAFRVFVLRLWCLVVGHDWTKRSRYSSAASRIYCPRCHMDFYHGSIPPLRLITSNWGPWDEEYKAIGKKTRIPKRVEI